MCIYVYIYIYIYILSFFRSSWKNNSSNSVIIIISPLKLNHKVRVEHQVILLLTNLIWEKQPIGCFCFNIG